MGALASVALAAVVRALRRILAQALEHGRQGISGPLGRVLSGPVAVELAAVMLAETGLSCAWIVAGLGRLMCRWKEPRSLKPPH